jgi:hypothetical protein
LKPDAIGIALSAIAARVPLGAERDDRVDFIIP